MNNNAWFKKENPFQTVIGFGGGATGFGAHSSSAVSNKYIEDVFSPYMYNGTEVDRTITNNVATTKGAMVWIKNRDNSAFPNYTYDTVRGVNKQLRTSSDAAETSSGNTLTAFNIDGFDLGTDTMANRSGDDHVAWTFKKKEGFFDIVEYTGNGSNRNIQHNLGCKPGCIMIKRTDSAEDWIVYHNGFYDFQASDHYFLKLNSTVGQQYGGSIWNNTAPTTTNFRVGQDDRDNAVGGTYIAYLFAGGSDRTTATSCSVAFDGSGDYLQIPSSADLCPGTSDFTFEAWIYPESWSTTIFQGIYVNGYDAGVSGALWIGNNPNSGGNFVVRGGGVTDYIQASYPEKKQWTHIAVTRSGSTLRLFYNGILKSSVSNSIDFPTTLTTIGSDGSGSDFLGKISNLRFVKGTAVYTAPFRPSTIPLTNITNTKLLCCQSSTVTTATVSPGTITATGNTGASIVTPFTDPGSFTLGENEDKNGIKCGFYQGNGSDDGPEVFIGWEPQFLQIKNSSDTENWYQYDSIRGIVKGGDDYDLRPNTTDSENNGDRLELTSTGFKLTNADNSINGTNDFMMYIAIRRPDGYVGKLPSAGTDVFAMDTGNASSTIPAFDSGFPVDYIFQKEPDSSSDNWYTGSRLTGLTNGSLNLTNAFGSWTDMVWDSNVGVTKNMTSSTQGWMFKRGQGMDVVTYKGDATWVRGIPHSLNQVPEMMWLKQTNTSGEEWVVYHKGLNGGTNPEQYYMFLHSDTAEADGDWAWSDTAPTSTHFTVGGGNSVNGTNDDQIAFLFASANNADGDPISKVGSYTGNGNATGPTVTLGFEPRFLLIKGTSSAEHWLVFDTLRGLSSSGTENRLLLNSTAAQDATYDYVNTTATGFTIHQTFDSINTNGGNYVYYAHA